jgi:hypothetical protein
MEVDIEQFLKLYSNPLDFQNFLSEHWRPRVGGAVVGVKIKPTPLLYLKHVKRKD